MTSFGQDVTINIGGVDYSVYIDTFSESGGEKQIQTIRTFGNNYEDVIVGREDLELEFDFRINTATLYTLFNSDTPVTIIITVGTDMTITYTDMMPSGLTISLETEDISMGTLGYHAPAYDGTKYNRVVT